MEQKWTCVHRFSVLGSELTDVSAEGVAKAEDGTYTFTCTVTAEDQVAATMRSHRLMVQALPPHTVATVIESSASH